MTQSAPITRYRLPTPYLPIYAALALAAGVLVGEQLQARQVFQCSGAGFQLHPVWLLAPLLALLPLLWWGRHQRRILIPLTLAFFVLLGAWRYLEHPFEPCAAPNALTHYHAEDRFGRPRVMEGIIVGYPLHRESYAQFVVRVTTLWEGEEALPVTGTALVRTDVNADFHYGDSIRIRGVPETPPSFPDFDYRRYLARKGIQTLVRRADLHLLATDQGNPIMAALYDVRARASALLDQLLPQPYAALANGMILGIESGIPRQLYDQFNLTGTSHVIVISGSNIALVSGLLLLIFTFLLRGRKKPAALLSLVGIGLYTLLVGADAAVVRAAIMGGLYVLAIALARQSAALITLFLAGLIMLLLNPLTLWDVGFQLSFMATLGLILFGTPLQQAWEARLGKRMPGPVNNLLAEGLLITLAAQITTMPMVVVYFGRLSLISFLANLLILPVQPPIMIAGGLAIILAAIFFPLGQLIAMIPWASLWWTVLVVEKTAAVSWGSIEVSSFGRLLGTLYYLGFGAGFLWWLVRREQKARYIIPPDWRPALLRGGAAAALAIALLWMGTSTLEARPDGRLHLQLLGLGDDVAWLISTPGGNRALLWDGRESAMPLATALSSSPRGRQPLDVLILTASPPDAAALADIDALQLLDATTDAPPGSAISLDAGVTLLRLPSATPLFRLSYGDFSTFLPLTNSQQEQSALAKFHPAPITVLITPWPGTGAWPQSALLNVLQPQLVLQPADTTYPPGVQAQLDAHPGHTRIPNDAITEIISDGRTVTLQQRAYPTDIRQR